MGGCLPDALEDEDDVPDTWEDLWWMTEGINN
jgi:hypothetical protein